MQNLELVNQVKNYVKKTFEQELKPHFTYHNFEHTELVVDASKRLSESAKLNDKESEILVIASYFHDLGFIISAENHENNGCKLAEAYLLEKSYDPKNIDSVKECIKATQMGIEPKSKLTRLIKDADLSGLASSQYHVLNENLRLEKSWLEGKEIKKKDWRKENIDFLQNHYYYTKEANSLFKDSKLKNLRALKMEEAKKKEKPKKIKNKAITIATSKSAQTQFKTALRNHIDLSSIADNKANIMLSVNAIIITVALPLLINRITEHPKLFIPTSILALVSLISMIFATLSTRPINMPGETDYDQIKNKNSNLFFFGNFYKMSYNDYVKYIKEVVSDDENMDNSITRDLFFLGKSLGKKFNYLRYCYNFFMYGIAAAVLSFFIVNLL